MTYYTSQMSVSPHAEYSDHETDSLVDARRWLYKTLVRNAKTQYEQGYRNGIVDGTVFDGTRASVRDRHRISMVGYMQVRFGPGDSVIKGATYTNFKNGRMYRAKPDGTID